MSKRHFLKRKFYQDSKRMSNKFILCKICDKPLQYITHTHLKKHGMSTKMYMLKFPFAPMQSHKLMINLSEHGKKQYKCNPMRYKEMQKNSRKHITTKSLQKAANRYKIGMREDVYTPQLLTLTKKQRGQMSQKMKETKRKKSLLEGKRLVRICKNCGKKYEWYRGARLYFCSRECYKKHIAIREKICDVCGKPYIPKRGGKDWKSSKYCSIKCTNESNKKRIPVSCNFCGEIIIRKPHEIKRGNNLNFCSFSCRGKYFTIGRKRDKMGRLI